MAKYTIYVIEGGKPTDVKAVQDGWNMSALKYGIFWILYNKLWAHFFLIMFVTFGLLIFLFDSDELNILFLPFWWFGISILSSYSAPDMLGRKLQKNFYKEVYVEPIEADSEDEAAKKYIREQALAERFEEKEDEIIDDEVIEDDWFTSLIVNFGIYLLPVISVCGIILLSKLFVLNF